MAALAQHLENHHAHLSGEMVVTDTGMSQRRLTRTHRHPGGRITLRKRHQAFENMRDLRAGEAVITMPALALGPDQTGMLQLAQMTAAGLQRDTRGSGQLAHGQGATVHEAIQNQRAGRITHQRGDAGKPRYCIHGSTSRFGRHTSMLAELWMPGKR